jgi:hypothetical protein
MKKTSAVIGILVLIFFLATACLKPREVPMISIDESINMYIVADSQTSHNFTTFQLNPLLDLSF